MKIEEAKGEKGCRIEARRRPPMSCSMTGPRGLWTMYEVDVDMDEYVTNDYVW
jgi:hypothetical protein